MAEFIQKGGDNGGSYASHFTCKLTVWEISYSISSNSSSVGYRLELISGSSGRFSDLKASYKVCLDSQGSPQYKEGSGTYSSQSYNTAQTICEGTRTVYHNDDGKKTIGCWASLDFESNTYSPGDFTVSGYVDLTTIPRYANVNISANSRTINKLTYNCSVDVAIDWKQYRLNGGNWIDDGGSNTISNLNPNTTYSIQVRVRRADSKLWSESNTISMTTYDIAKISSLPDFEHGNDIITNITNPASISNLILAMKIGDVEILNRKVVKGENSIQFSDTELDNLYKQYANSSNLTAIFVLTGDGYTDSKTCIVTLKGNQKTVKINKDSTWKRGKIWTNVNGTWKRAIIWTNVNGTWKKSI